jgi:hypothetical protein
MVRTTYWRRSAGSTGDFHVGHSLTVVTDASIAGKTKASSGGSEHELVRGSYVGIGWDRLMPSIPGQPCSACPRHNPVSSVSWFAGSDHGRKLLDAGVGPQDGQEE